MARKTPSLKQKSIKPLDAISCALFASDRTIKPSCRPVKFIGFVIAVYRYALLNLSASRTVSFFHSLSLSVCGFIFGSDLTISNKFGPLRFA